MLNWRKLSSDEAVGDFWECEDGEVQMDIRRKDFADGDYEVLIYDDELNLMKVNDRDTRLETFEDAKACAERMLKDYRQAI